MFMGENVEPDFTAMDYVLGFDFMEFGDRYFRLPFAFYNDDSKPWIPEIVTEDYARELLKKKKDNFCVFCYSHTTKDGIREQFFKDLSKGVRQVTSIGPSLNNIGVTKRISYAERSNYISRSKFMISFENMRFPGYVTEKIIDPLRLHTIPIYYGSPQIKEDINAKAIIEVNEIPNFEEAIERVRYLDTHDDAYIEMLCQPPLLSDDYQVKLYERLEEYLVRIFSQDKEKAYRRARWYVASTHEACLKRYWRYSQKVPSIVKRIVEKLGWEL